MRYVWSVLGIVCWGMVTVASAHTVCEALRAIEQEPKRVYIVRCSTGEVEIKEKQYRANTGKGGNLQQFCPAGSTFLSAGGPLRWKTDSGFPEPCDVFSARRGEKVKDAAVVYFVHDDFFEEEIDTAVHELVYHGHQLIDFDPPVPGIVVEGIE